MTAPRLALVILLALPLGGIGTAALADELPPKIADSVLAVAKDRGAVITLNGGREISGTIAAYDRESITFIEGGTGRIVAVARIDVASVRLIEVPAPAPTLTLAPPEPPAKKRHVGLMLGFGPGNVYLDLDYGHFYGFIGTSIGYPIIFAGGGGNDQYFGFSVGAGGSWKLSPHSNWKFDLVGTLTPTWWGGFSAGIGVSAGFHYTSPNGFTAGFKIPIIGVAPGCSTIFSGDSEDGGSCPTIGSGASLIANYYLQSAMSSPTITVGYRF